MGFSVLRYELFFLNVILAFFSYFVPKKKNLFLMGSKDAQKFYGNTKYFFLYLCKNRDAFNCKPFWITANKKLFNSLNEKNLPTVYLYSFKGFKTILQSYYILWTHGINGVSYAANLPGRFNLVQTNHGPTMKKLYLDTEFKLPIIGSLHTYLMKRGWRSWHTVLAISKPDKEDLVKKLQNKNVYLLGYPRNDVLFNRELVFENFEKKFSLDKYKKIILYCPTYRDEPSRKRPFSRTFLDKLNDYLEKNNYILLTKFHVDEKIPDLVENRSRIKNVTSEVEDLQDLIIYSDLLITDYSSLVFDYVLIDKPIIFYPYDYDEYFQHRGTVYDYYNEFPGPFAKNEEDVLDLIQNADNFFTQQDYQLKFKKFKKKHNEYFDDKNCERLYRHLIQNQI